MSLPDSPAAAQPQPEPAAAQPELAAPQPPQPAAAGPIASPPQYGPPPVAPPQYGAPPVAPPQYGAPPVAPPQYGPPPVAPEPTAPLPVKPKRSPVALIIIILLALALIATVIFLVLYIGRLDDANAHIKDQKEQIKEQEDLIDKKETFGAAMQGLSDTVGQFNGSLVGSLVPMESYDRLAQHGWTHRWDVADMVGDIADVESATKDLQAVLDAAATQASTNTSGSIYETVIDQLGSGFVSSALDDADTLCGSDVLACVTSDDQYTVHFDAADSNLPYYTDFMRTGVAYHEFAHVLQFANPGPTETAVESFGGDSETMADCFALTYLDGWKLDHRTFVSRYEYWDVSIGYGYTCNDDQKQVIRDWYGQLAFASRAFEQ